MAIAIVGRPRSRAVACHARSIGANSDPSASTASSRARSAGSSRPPPAALRQTATRPQPQPTVASSTPRKPPLYRQIIPPTATAPVIPAATISGEVARPALAIRLGWRHRRAIVAGSAVSAGGGRHQAGLRPLERLCLCGGPLADEHAGVRLSRRRATMLAARRRLTVLRRGLAVRCGRYQSGPHGERDERTAHHDQRLQEVRRR